MKTKKQLFTLILSAFLIATGIVNVSANGEISQTKKNDTGYLSGYNSVDKHAGYNSVSASTESTGKITIMYTKGSLKLNSTGEIIWNRSQSGDNGESTWIRHHTTKYYDKKVAFYTTHESIYTTSTVIYLVNTAS